MAPITSRGTTSSRRPTSRQQIRGPYSTPGSQPPQAPAPAPPEYIQPIQLESTPDQHMPDIRLFLNTAENAELEQLDQTILELVNQQILIKALTIDSIRFIKTKIHQFVPANEQKEINKRLDLVAGPCRHEEIEIAKKLHVAILNFKRLRNRAGERERRARAHRSARTQIVQAQTHLPTQYYTAPSFNHQTSTPTSQVSTFAGAPPGTTPPGAAESDSDSESSGTTSQQGQKAEQPETQEAEQAQEIQQSPPDIHMYTHFEHQAQVPHAQAPAQHPHPHPPPSQYHTAAGAAVYNNQTFASTPTLAPPGTAEPLLAPIDSGGATFQQDEREEARWLEAWHVQHAHQTQQPQAEAQHARAQQPHPHPQAQYHAAAVYNDQTFDPTPTPRLAPPNGGNQFFGEPATGSGSNLNSNGTTFEFQNAYGPMELNNFEFYL